jgi:hypothetical protein
LLPVLWNNKKSPRFLIVSLARQTFSGKLEEVTLMTNVGYGSDKILMDI